MPQSRAVRCAQRQDVSGGISGKRQSCIRGEHAGAGPAVTHFVAPTNLARLVINGFDDASPPEVVIGPCPAVRAILRLGKVDAVAGMRVDDKQAGLWIEARGTVVGHAAFVGSDQPSVALGLLVRIRNGTSVLVDSESPVCRPIGCGQQALSVRTV